MTSEDKIHAIHEAVKEMRGDLLCVKKKHDRLFERVMGNDEMRSSGLIDEVKKNSAYRKAAMKRMGYLTGALAGVLWAASELKEWIAAKIGI